MTNLLPTSARHPAEQETHDPLVVCGTRHVASLEPRSLCRVVDRGDRRGGPRLEVRVSACQPASSDGPTSALVLVSGDLDTYCARRIGDSVREFIVFAHDVVVDLASVRTIDCVGVDLIESMCRSVDRRGGSLAIHDPNIMVERILQIRGLGAEIPLCRPG